jgi:hypothetical protein
MSGKFLLIYICNFHVLSHLLMIYICKLHWNREKVIDLRRVPGIDNLADKALIGYLKIIAELNRNKGILDYRNEPRLTQNGTAS